MSLLIIALGVPVYYGWQAWTRKHPAAPIQ
jgi:APA family basic amino acid/polyamine antiporter